MFEAENEMERAIVAGASEALRAKAKNPKATDEEIIKHVVKKLKEMKNKID